MNLILFDEAEITPDTGEIILPPDDERAVHIKKILKTGEGSVIDAGIINGGRGKAEILSSGKQGMKLRLTADEETTGLHPLTLLLGLSRPPTVKKVLKEATALGVDKFILCGTENGERSYRQSSMLKPDNIRKVLLEGAQQAYCTMLPEVEIFWDLKKAVETISSQSETAESSRLIALDNYEAAIPLSGYWAEAQNVQKQQPVSRRIILAVGSERGWTGSERNLLRTAGFTLCSLGPRVLRTETASIAGAAVCLSGMGII